MSAGPRRLGDVSRGVRIAALLLCCACRVEGATAQEQPAEKPEQETPPPKPKRPQRLVLDIDKHVERKLEQEAKIAPPRFQDSIEVVARSPQMLLERFFGGVDLECGPAGGGPPGHVESREARPHMAPYIDMVALAHLLSGLGGKGKGPERYFLYRMNRGESSVFTVREARLTAAEGAAPGGTFELVETFPDLGSAMKAWRRMERGFATPVGSDALPPPAWATTTCRPRKR